MVAADQVIGTSFHRTSRLELPTVVIAGSESFVMVYIFLLPVNTLLSLAQSTVAHDDKLKSISA